MSSSTSRKGEQFFFCFCFLVTGTGFTGVGVKAGVSTCIDLDKFLATLLVKFTDYV